MTVSYSMCISHCRKRSTAQTAWRTTRFPATATQVIGITIGHMRCNVCRKLSSELSPDVLVVKLSFSVELKEKPCSGDWSQFPGVVSMWKLGCNSGTNHKYIKLELHLWMAFASGTIQEFSQLIFLKVFFVALTFLLKNFRKCGSCWVWQSISIT